MNYDTMSAMLGRRLEDEDSSKFPMLNRIDAVNNAMLRLVNLLDNDQLEELRTMQTVAPTVGVYALGSLTTDLVRNGVQKVYSVTDSKWLHLVDPMDLEKTGNLYLTPSADYGITYIYGTNLTVLPAASGTSITIWYLKQPTPYTTVSTSRDDECPLNPALHPLVVDLAEAELWKQDGKGEKAIEVLKIANKEIQTLNERAVAERKETVGKTQ